MSVTRRNFLKAFLGFIGGLAGGVFGRKLEAQPLPIGERLHLPLLEDYYYKGGVGYQANSLYGDSSANLENWAADLVTSLQEAIDHLESCVEDFGDYPDNSVMVSLSKDNWDFGTVTDGTPDFYVTGLDALAGE